MIASETRNRCAAVQVMDLSTRANSGAAGESGDGGNGRRRSGAGRPAKSVFSIRSLVGEDTAAVHQHPDDEDRRDGDRTAAHRPRHRRRRDDGDCRDDDENDAGE